MEYIDLVQGITDSVLGTIVLSSVFSVVSEIPAFQAHCTSRLGDTLKC